MKKLLSVITGMIAGSALYAMPVLNPAEPVLVTDGVFFCDDDSCWGLKLGYRGDFVYNRRMESAILGEINDFELYSNSVLVTLNLWDRLDIYGFVGPASYELNNLQANNVTNVLAHGVSQLGTLWGIGAKVCFYELCWGQCGTTYFGLDAQWEQLTTTGFDRAAIDGATVASTGGMTYKEAQIAFGVAHRIWNLVPYLAVKWSNAHTSSRNGFTIGTGGNSTVIQPMNNLEHIGWAMGCTLVDANRMTVTAEARWKDEKALSVSGEFRF